MNKSATEILLIHHTHTHNIIPEIPGVLSHTALPRISCMAWRSRPVFSTPTAAPCMRVSGRKQTACWQPPNRKHAAHAMRSPRACVCCMFERLWRRSANKWNAVRVICAYASRNYRPIQRRKRAKAAGFGMRLWHSVLLLTLQALFKI